MSGVAGRGASVWSAGCWMNRELGPGRFLPRVQMDAQSFGAHSAELGVRSPPKKSFISGCIITLVGTAKYPLTTCAANVRRVDTGKRG